MTFINECATILSLVKNKRKEKLMQKNFNTIDEGNRKVTDEERETFVEQLTTVLVPVLGKNTPQHEHNGRENEPALINTFTQRQDPNAPSVWKSGTTKVQISDAVSKSHRDNGYDTNERGDQIRRTVLDSEFMSLEVTVFHKNGSVKYPIYDDSTTPTEESFDDKAQYDRLMTVLTSLEVLQRGKGAKFSERVKAIRAIKEASIEESRIELQKNF